VKKNTRTATRELEIETAILNFEKARNAYLERRKQRTLEEIEVTLKCIDAYKDETHS
jgi:hypothetical protein